MPQGKRVKDQTFAFDRVFDENITQADVYEATTKNLLDSVLDGYNATVFAYGATGCGKTHTITGTAQQPGIIFLTMQELFERLDERRGEQETEITLSYLEIYNETIRDLLNPGTVGKQGLMLREDAHSTVSVAGLSSHRPQNVAEVMDMVIRGNSARTQSPTEANATSSRSHAVLQVNVSSKARNADVHEPVTMATLSIIDLAGSERASATKNRGERLLEGANINKSLLALGSCINALCDPRKKNHVPYRNSKLTRLLKFSLGGNCRTVMIVCVSPSSQHFDETQNTLRYANRAKNIQTKSVRNVYNVDRHVKDYLKKIDEQMNRINELTAQQKQHEELAFVKFRKAGAKKMEIAREGLQRIRLAFDHSSEERKERINNMRRLRQLERRIGATSGWVGAFDQVCETREEEEPPSSLLAIRKTASGILLELESSRQHYHQRLGKDNWSRAIDTALSDGIRQLQAADCGQDSAEAASLRKEVEMLKGKADIEAHLAVLEQERGSEQTLMAILLTANFETVAILNRILQMSEDEAVDAARQVLGKLLQSCTEAVGQVVKPDGGLHIVEAVPPTRSGTPRKRRQLPLAGPSPLRARLSAVPPHLSSDLDASSPMLRAASPKRKVRLGSAKKGVVLLSTPRRRSPIKKRAVRWRDESEEAMPLADFQATPKAIDSDSSAQTLTPLTSPETNQLMQHTTLETGSSPLPTIPELHKDGLSRPASGRFAAGFLSKKQDASPSQAPPSLSHVALSSEDESSPLREIAANSAPRPRTSYGSALPRPSPPRASSNDDTDTSSTTSDQESMLANKDTASKIRSAIKHRRASSLGVGAVAARRRDSIHRRRSPTASSPPSGTDAGIFSTSHARRMVKSERDDSLRSVLSPRVASVMKGTGSTAAMRRSTLEPGMGLHRDAVAVRAPGRLSSVLPGNASSSSGSKAVWR